MEAQVLTGLTVFAADAADGNAAHWIQLTPRGAFTARDGRSFNTSPEKLVERFKADGVAVPIDVDHATATRSSKGESAPAVGWIEELQARTDGLYGRVNWLTEGLRILKERTHRYISPALKADDDGNAIWLHSAALVAAPAVSMPAVAAAQTEQGTNPMDMKAILAALGLQEGATIEDVIAAILLLKNKAASSGAPDALAATFENMAVGAAKELRAADMERRKAKVETAIMSGTFPPALREWAVDLVIASEDSFDKFCAKIGKPMAYLFTSVIDDKDLHRMNADGRRSTPEIAGARSDVAAMLGIDPKKLD